MKLLLVEDNPGDVRLLREMLGAHPQSQFCITIADRIASCRDFLREGEFDLLLLDLSLPDGEGLDTLRQVHSVAPNLPVIVLTGLDDEDIAIAAVREGAQDYLIKGKFDEPLLARAIRYALERHRLMMALESMALVDELTGLYNRRGFVTIANEQLKYARRAGHSLAVVFIDLDGMKMINDNFGHQAGDRALVETAAVLRSAFRNSDVVARMGGDEFAVLAIRADPGAASGLLRRLRDNLERANKQAPPSVRLSLSVGIAHCDPRVAPHTAIEGLIAEADRAMYEDKRRHQEAMVAQPQGRPATNGRQLAPQHSRESGR